MRAMLAINADIANIRSSYQSEFAVSQVADGLSEIDLQKS